VIRVTGEFNNQWIGFSSENVLYVAEEGPNKYAVVHLEGGSLIQTNMPFEEVMKQVEEEEYARK
jgi:hypothetical protein